MLDYNKIKKELQAYKIKEPLIAALYGHRILATQIIHRDFLVLEFLNIFYSHLKTNFNEESVKFIKKPNLVEILFDSDSEKLKEIFENRYKDKFENFNTFLFVINSLKKFQIGLDSVKSEGKFLYPYSFNMLFHNDSSRRNNFTRSGELLYLMVKRSKYFEEFKKLLVEKFSYSKWDKIISLLDDEYFSKEEKLGYLPYKEHFVYDLLVKNLIKVLNLDIPKRDIFYYFNIVMSFFMSFYILSVARKDFYFVVEILNKKSDNVRRKSRETYRMNEEAIIQSIDIYIQKYKIDKKDIKIKNLIEAHRTYLRGILSSRENTNAYRYSISDDFLKTLVLLNVKDKMNVEKFLDIIYQEYRIIISEKHSKMVFELSSYSDFRKNEQRLIKRLKMLGFIEEKSDGDIYIKVSK